MFFLKGLKQIQAFLKDKALGANTLTRLRVLFEQIRCSDMHFSWSKGCHTCLVYTLCSKPETRCYHTLTGRTVQAVRRPKQSLGSMPPRAARPAGERWRGALNLIKFPHVNISEALPFIPLGCSHQSKSEMLNFNIDQFLMVDKL